MEFSDILYNNDKFAACLSRSLGDDGILVSQVGEDDFLNDPGSHVSEKKFEYKFINHLQNNGFKAAKEYSEAHGGFLGVWHYMIVFKDRSTLANWYSNQAEIDLKIRRRGMKVKNKLETPFRYFDGAAMMDYQFPTRINEEVFCRSLPRPAFCEEQHGFDPFKENTPASALEVKQSLTQSGEPGLFTKQSISEGAYIAIEEKVNAILSTPFTTEIIRLLGSHLANNYLKSLSAYLSQYGHGHDFHGMYSMSVEPSRMNFLNHVCDASEVTSDLDAAIDLSFYSPFIDRNYMLLLRAAETMTRDLLEGEEVLGNYLSILTDKNIESRRATYRAQCLSEGSMV